MTDELKAVIAKLNEALNTIEETAEITHSAVFNKECDRSEEWRWADISDFCYGLKQSIRDNARYSGYYYW